MRLYKTSMTDVYQKYNTGNDFYDMIVSDNPYEKDPKDTFPVSKYATIQDIPHYKAL